MLIVLPTNFKKSHGNQYKKIEFFAVLIVPFEEKEEHFVTRFDPRFGYLKLIEAMRFKKHLR